MVIIGGGPSGLAAAHEAAGHGASVMVLERHDRLGGLARTIPFKGNRFDIGPHRFITKNEEVHRLFVDLLGDELVKVPRLTRILNRNKYFDYPLTPINAVLGVGFVGGTRIGASYAVARMRRAYSPKSIHSFEDWIVDRFGRRLYEHFFREYTEKVWGIPCSQIGSDWAEQRIRGLSLGGAIRNALFKGNSRSIKTLADEFAYPRLGAGQLYEIMAEGVVRRGGRVASRANVKGLRREGKRILAAEVGNGCDAYEIVGRFFLASAPLTDLIQMMRPEAPAKVQQAARALRYREHIGVNLVVDGLPFPDNWIYVHSPDVAVARIANYRNFSPAMASNADVSPLTVEYFATPGDALSAADNQTLIARAADELRRLRLVEPEAIRGAFVVRSDKAYPSLEIGHRDHIATLKEWLDQFENLLPIGRSGMFKYNNQDHAMATGLYAARTALGIAKLDPWRVNIDAEYSESGPTPL